MALPLYGSVSVKIGAILQTLVQRYRYAILSILLNSIPIRDSFKFPQFRYGYGYSIADTF